MKNKGIIIQVYLLLNSGKLKLEHIHFNNEVFSAGITTKTREHLDKKYKNYTVIGVSVFEMVAELKDL